MRTPFFQYQSKLCAIAYLKAKPPYLGVHECGEARLHPERANSQPTA